MLEKPALQDKDLVDGLRAEYGVQVTQISFLPLGADVNTAVYRLLTDVGTSYFLKLRSGPFDPTSVLVPKFLSEQGIEQIIPPLTTGAGELWSCLGSFKTILYPFVQGQNGYEHDLLDNHWHELGAMLKQIHATQLPPPLLNHLQREAYTSHWRASVLHWMRQIESGTLADPVAAKAAALLKNKRTEILGLVERTERLAHALQTRPSELVVCHADIHAGNVLITPEGALYMVDWDTVCLAPPERDLMFVGGGQFGKARTPSEEETLFYHGYGQTQVDPKALTYFRYERIIQDIAAYSEQLLLTGAEGGEDRDQALRYLTANFLPNGALAIAVEAYRKPHASCHPLDRRKNYPAPGSD